ncbi:MAG: radical SAM protein [Candidatus Latescibacteria bacterium]|nr:radical SAM protein [Candidatus Latescibacterota bacterium]
MNESQLQSIMKSGTSDEKILAIKTMLEMDDETFAAKITSEAHEITQQVYGNRIFVCGLLALGNYCKNDCTYCGLRVSNSAIPRFRLALDDMKKATDTLRKSGITRIFYVGGEDPGFPVDNLFAVIEHAKDMDIHVTLGVGVFQQNILAELHDAGVDCYTLKFETSNRAMFNRIKPTSDFDERMECIKSIKPLGMELGSGNIVGLEGQTLDDVATDITLMYNLDIDWAPVVPYLPAPGTPMAETTPMGNVALTLRELSVLRILLPESIITAGQPTQGSKLGFADPEGNKAALDAGANILFVDVTPFAVRRDFVITPGRILPGVAGIDKLLEGKGLQRV